MKKPEPRRPRALRGIPASPGIAVGVAHRMEDPLLDIEERTISEREVEAEIARFQNAVSQARAELTGLRESTRRDLDEDMARIFDVQLQMVDAGRTDGFANVLPEGNGGNDAPHALVGQPGDVVRVRQARGAGHLAGRDPAEV